MAWTEPPNRRGVYRGRYRDPVTGNAVTAGKATSIKKAMAIAVAAEQDAIKKTQQGAWIDPRGGKITFAEYFENQWFPNVEYEDQTKTSYWSTYSAHLKDEFGPMPLNRILSSHVQGWVTRQKGTAQPSTIRKRFAHLQTILAGVKGVSARRDRLIDYNPCEGVRLPTVPKRKVQIYTPEQVEKLALAMDPWWRLIPAFWSETGIRWGELAGVQVDDLTLGYKHVIIRRTIVEVRKGEGVGGTQFKRKDYPKDIDERTLALTPELSAAIETHIKQRKLEPDDLLFAMPKKRKYGSPGIVLIAKVLRTAAWPGGVPMTKGFFRKQVWIPSIERAEVPYRRPYDLRASSFSWLLAWGASTADVMERAGHVKSSTTDKYLTALDADTAALEAFARMRSGKKPLALAKKQAKKKGRKAS